MSKILIVDDTPKNIQLLANILSDENHEIEYSLNGKEAIETVETEDFDLILMDVMMPEVDGYQACKAIKQMESKSEIPIIFITAKTDIDSLAEGFDAGGVDYISKPFNEKELMARVNTQLTLKDSKDQLRDMNEILEAKVLKRTEELDKKNEELKNANIQLSELDDAKNKFLSIISHEIRTPLTGIFCFSDMLKEMANLDESAVEMIEALETSCKRLEAFSYSALDITNLNSVGDKALACEEFEIADLIEDVLASLESDAQSKEIEVEQVVRASKINADRSYLEKCLKMTIGNAIKHSPEKSKVSVVAENKEESYSLTVKDQGSGFPQEVLENGAGLFNSPDHCDLDPGLDLHLCNLIIGLHSGTISIENDNGAMINIEIPLAINDSMKNKSCILNV